MKALLLRLILEHVFVIFSPEVAQPYAQTILQLVSRLVPCSKCVKVGFVLCCTCS